MSKIRLSCDDGCASDVRLAELCKKYRVDCTFYWPVEWHSLAYANGYKPLTAEQAIKIAASFEIGSHSITHRHLTKLLYDEAIYEIDISQLLLEQLFHIQVTKFAPPRGYTNEELTEYTLAIYESQRLTKGKGLVHIHPNSGANHNTPWRDYFNSIKDTEEEIELWGHSHEFDRFDLWEELEGFLRENTST